MEDKFKFNTIFLSEELRRAKGKALTTNDLDPTSDDPKPAQSLLRQDSHHWSLGIRRSLASTDLINHPHTAHCAVSLVSQEGALTVGSDTGDELNKMELLPSSDITHLDLKSSIRNRLLSLEHTVPAGGEGMSTAASTDKALEGGKWEEVREGKAKAGPGDESFGSFLSIDEEDEAEEGSLTEAERPKKTHRHVTRGSTGSTTKHLQEFHSIPKRLIPSKISHCLYNLEEECRGVERESRKVKWKMEQIRSSVEALEVTLRTCLTHLVEAETSDTSDLQTPSPPTALSSPMAPAPVLDPAPSQPDSDLSVDRQISNNYCTNQHCLKHRGLARYPSESCLPETYQNRNSRAQLTDSIEKALPSCAQQQKERAAAVHAIMELRTEVERLRLTQEEEHREHQEILQNFQSPSEPQCCLLSQGTGPPADHQASPASCGSDMRASGSGLTRSCRDAGTHQVHPADRTLQQSTAMADL